MPRKKDKGKRKKEKVLKKKYKRQKYVLSGTKGLNLGNG